MALVELTEEEKTKLRINSFDPKSGTLGAGFVFVGNTTNSTNTEFTNTYNTNNQDISQVICRQTKTVSEGITTFFAYTLNRNSGFVCGESGAFLKGQSGNRVRGGL